MKHLKYLKYLIIHKWWVFYYCCKLGIPFRGLFHDMSKFLPSEWFFYVGYFYGNTKEDKFDIAWLKHQHRNPHHYQYWILKEDNGKEKLLDIPDKYIKEMVADWCGAGRAITGKLNIEEWYNTQHAKGNLKINFKSKRKCIKYINKIVGY